MERRCKYTADWSRSAAAQATVNGLGTVAANTLLADESRAGQATTMGLNGAALSLSSAVGGSVGGLVLALGGYHAIGVVVPIFGLAAAVLVWLTRPPTQVQLVPLTWALDRSRSRPGQA